MGMALRAFPREGLCAHKTPGFPPPAPPMSMVTIFRQVRAAELPGAGAVLRDLEPLCFSDGGDPIAD